MSNSTNKYGDISNRNGVKAIKRLLRRGLPIMISAMFAQVDAIGQNQGKVAKWRRFNTLPYCTAPLVEGVPPSGQRITVTDYTATLEEFGDFVEMTDALIELHEDPIPEQAKELLSEQFAGSIEILGLEVMKSTTNRFYANRVAGRSSVVTAISVADLRRIQRQLARDLAKPISTAIAATEMVSTKAVPKSLYGLVHTDLRTDLYNLTGFKRVEEYANAGVAHEAEIGAFENIRFLGQQLLAPWKAAGASSESFLANGEEPASATNCDVYPVLIFGKDAYAFTQLSGYDNFMLLVANPKPGPGNELAQKGSIGWKTWWAGAVTCDAWIVCYEVACTASPA